MGFVQVENSVSPAVSPRMNTITSRDQFKPIRIGENIVVNYNGLCTSSSATQIVAFS